eukprot:TRINITY_DN4493_c0_g1_i10.p1 TRINITY_DN4493_c0_g1~~TRINITY_DN4493_c0_g1_i10.p1  ORF type:complete len:581 (+),score=86.39 TRINITY_DN4493_c0_g1_i10:647-2389(+)
MQLNLIKRQLAFDNNKKREQYNNQHMPIIFQEMILMKIAISCNGKDKESLLDTRFGRCKYFQIHDTEEKTVEILENKGKDASGGAGIVASNQLIDEKVNVIITGNLGPNAFGLIEKAEIKAYKCESISIKDVLDKYKNNELEEITFSGNAHHGMNIQIGGIKAMNIAVLSGKGGTGKTTVSTNLALALRSNYIDCDVEEPNGFIFLNPKIEKDEKVMVDYPVINSEKCTSCGKCVSVCQFNALAKVKDDIVLFEKLCHGCGACEIACEYGALTYKKRELGKIEKGTVRDLSCQRGILNISEPMAVPVIRELLKNSPKAFNLIDCPPGTSCNVVTSLKYANGAILVTEPSEFGLHDLKMAVELVKMYNIPFGIIINKDDGKDNIVKKYCKDENINLIGTIPYNKNTAVLYSQGKILYDDLEHKNLFDKLADKVKEVLKWNQQFQVEKVEQVKLQLQLHQQNLQKMLLGQIVMLMHQIFICSIKEMILKRVNFQVVKKLLQMNRFVLNVVNVKVYVNLMQQIILILMIFHVKDVEHVYQYVHKKLQVQKMKKQQILLLLNQIREYFQEQKWKQEVTVQENQQ